MKDQAICFLFRAFQPLWKHSIGLEDEIEKLPDRLQMAAVQYRDSYLKMDALEEASKEISKRLALAKKNKDEALADLKSQDSEGHRPASAFISALYRARKNL